MEGERGEKLGPGEGAWARVEERKLRVREDKQTEDTAGSELVPYPPEDCGEMK